MELLESEVDEKDWLLNISKEMWRIKDEEEVEKQKAMRMEEEELKIVVYKKKKEQEDKVLFKEREVKLDTI